MIHARFIALTGAAKACIHTRQCLQLQCYMLYHMAHPGAFLYTGEETTFHTL